MAVEDGDQSIDAKILKLYKAGKRTSEIAVALGLKASFVCRRLRSMERYGEVNRRADGQWSAGKCALPTSKRACGKADFSIFSTICLHCEHRRDRRP